MIRIRKRFSESLKQLIGSDSVSDLKTITDVVSPVIDINRLDNPNFTSQTRWVKNFLPVLAAGGQQTITVDFNIAVDFQVSRLRFQQAIFLGNGKFSVNYRLFGAALPAQIERDFDDLSTNALQGKFLSPLLDREFFNVISNNTTSLTFEMTITNTDTIQQSYALTLQFEAFRDNVEFANFDL